MNNIEQLTITTVCRHFNVAEENVLGKIRTRELVNPRHIIWYFLSRKGYSHPRIGKIFSTSASSVCIGIQTIKNYLSVNDPIKIHVDQLKATLNPQYEAEIK